MTTTTIIAFYKFVKLTNIEMLQSDIQQFCETQSILGTLLLAEEGINGTVAGNATSIEALLTFLRTNSSFSDLDCKYSTADFIPFKRLKILIKKEIVTLGIPGIDPEQKTGIPVTPEIWNQLISDPEVLVIDTRNTYEVELGTFKGAINPETETFGDFPDYVQQNLSAQKQRKIAMFCTGGIRCEKASAYLLEQGFETVYQLEGGILRYLQNVTPQDSLWQGDCFIFDRRITV